MTRDLVPLTDPPGEQLALPQPVVERVREMILDGVSPATRRAYRADWEIFVNWCERMGRVPLPCTADTLAAFLVEQADSGLHTSTLEGRLAAIRKAHELKGFPSPTTDPMVKAAIRGIRRTYGSAPNDVALPLRLVQLQAIVGRLTARTDIQQARTRALLLIGWAGAFRRSELVAIDVEHVQWHRGGIRIQIPFSKTDQEGRGQSVAIPAGKNAATCPCRALGHWFTLSGVSSGAVFRSFRRLPGLPPRLMLTGRLPADEVNNTVKAAVRAIGAERPDDYSAHSLRAGFVTEAAERGVPLHVIRQQTRHEKIDTLIRYIRAVRALEDSAAGKVGL